MTTTIGTDAVRIAGQSQDPISAERLQLLGHEVARGAALLQPMQLPANRTPERGGPP